jgi:hypothetical protein
MDPLFLLMLIVLVAGTAYGLPQLGRQARLRRRMRRQPIVALADVRDGQVVRVRAVVAVVEAPPPPFGDRPAVVHLTQIIDTSNPGATTTFRCNGRGEIRLDDGTGRARITRDTRIELLVEEESGGVHRDDPELAQLLGDELERIFSKGATLVWRRRALCVGDAILVWGRAVVEPDPDPPRQAEHYRHETRRVNLVPCDERGAVVIERAKR